MDCDVCRMEFPSSTPNPAILDAPLRGHGGMWAGFCVAHKGNAVPNMGTWLTPEAKAKYGKRRAKV